MTMGESYGMDKVLRRLNSLRLSLRLWQCGAGASRLLTAITLLTLVSLAVDRNLRMDFTQRLISLLIGLAILVGMIWRVLVRPLCRRVSAVSLLMRVERRNPELRGRLTAAWEYATLSEPPPGASPTLLASAIQDGCAAAAKADFQGVLDWRRLLLRARLGILGLAVLVTLSCVMPDTLKLWYARNVLLADVEWPRLTHLAVQNLVAGELQVPVAGDLEVLVRVEGVAPDEVVFRYADDTGASYSEQMPLIGSEYRTLFRGVTEPFRLQIVGGDDRTEWITVRLLPRPEITDVAVAVTPPAYTSRKRTVQDARVGTHAVLTGSGVEILGRSSLPLREVSLAIDANRLQTLALPGATNFAVALTTGQVKTATYRLQAVSDKGIPTLRPTTVGLRVEPDRPPRVTATLDGIGQIVLSRAVVPVVGELQDDCGVASAWLEYQYQSPTGQVSGAMQTPLQLPEAPATGGVLRVSHAMELTPLRLDPDATVSLRVTAKDGNTLTGPGQGQSSSFTLRVVTEEVLRQELIKREQVLRQRLERLIQEQRFLADESRLFHSSTEPLRDRGAGRALQAEKRQRQVLPTLAAITAGLAQIRAEASNNRLEPAPSPLLNRLDNTVLGPLRDVSTALLPEASSRVAAARQRTNDTERRAVWREAETAQRRVVTALMDVRKNLEASQDVSELMRLMERILSDQKNVNRETMRKATSAIEDIFEKK